MNRDGGKETDNMNDENENERGTFAEELSEVYERQARRYDSILSEDGENG